MQNLKRFFDEILFSPFSIKKTRRGKQQKDNERVTARAKERSEQEKLWMFGYEKTKREYDGMERKENTKKCTRSNVEMK